MPATVGSKEMPQQKVDMVVRPPYDFCSKVSQKCLMLSSGYAQCKAECEPGKDGWCTELVHLRAVELNPGLRLFWLLHEGHRLDQEVPRFGAVQDTAISRCQHF